MLDYYRVLNVSSDIKQSELKKAYIKRLKQFHPDIYHGRDATDKTQKINQAYQTLKDPTKRARYDQELAFAYNKNKNPFKNQYQSQQSRYKSSSYNGNGGGNTAQGGIVAYLAAEFQQRGKTLAQEVQDYIQTTLQKCTRFISAGGEYYSILEATRKDFEIFKSQMLRQNIDYYRQYSDHAGNFSDEIKIMRLSSLQEANIKKLTHEAWHIITAQLENYYNSAIANRKNTNFNKLFNGFFWAGIALSLVLPLLSLTAAIGCYFFGNKTPRELCFLAGSIIGLLFKLIFFAM